jgi:hypothetical protein
VNRNRHPDVGRSRWLLSDEARPLIQIPSPARREKRQFRLPEALSRSRAWRARARAQRQAAHQARSLDQWSALGQTLAMQADQPAPEPAPQRAATEPPGPNVLRWVTAALVAALLLAIALLWVL